MEVFIFIALFFLFIFYMASWWAVFAKAGYSGWFCLIPIFNLYIMIKIVNESGWLMLLYLVPVVNLFLHAYINFKLAQHFGKGFLFSFGLICLNFIFMPILGFGSATYKKVHVPNL